MSTWPKPTITNTTPATAMMPVMFAVNSSAAPMAIGHSPMESA
ncbi:MAG: hypothetical protein WKG01_01825 [Kofleriaceae bacterium]